MSKAKQCDRCDKFYPTKGEAKMRLTKLSQTASRYARTIDLCPKCEAQLIEWFEEGKKHD